MNIEEQIRSLFDTFEKDNDGWKSILDEGGEYLARKYSPKSPEHDFYLVYEEDLKEVIEKLTNLLTQQEQEIREDAVRGFVEEFTSGGSYEGVKSTEDVMKLWIKYEKNKD